MSKKDYSSFRGPSGFIYYKDDKVFRKINKSYMKVYDFFMSSGLYAELVKSKYIVSHQEFERTEDYIILEVEKIPFISYPYEWCFDQIKDAALLTLKINLIALNYGMILKDASAYNVQFLNGNPIFIDTLSFDIYEENTPWGAYGQFSRHFTAPLLLMNSVDERLNSMLKNYIDGIPLDITEAILKKRGGFFAKQHIVWQNKAIKKHNIDGKNKKLKSVKIEKKSLININVMMQSQILNLERKKTQTEWDDYYDNTNYSLKSAKDKEAIIKEFIKKIKVEKCDIAIDMGANDGKYSRLISSQFSEIVALDIDYNSVNKNYITCKENNENILPLVFDFNNPTPSIGFACQERNNLEIRSSAKLIMSLALIHHIAISNNVPFEKIANWFSLLAEYLIIEFVPKSDSQVKILLNTRKDIFDDYNQETFEKEFSKIYKIIEKKDVKDSKRTMYLMVRK